MTLILNSMQFHLAYPSTYKIRLNTHTHSHTILSPLVLGLFIIQKKGAGNLPSSSLFPRKIFQRSVLFIFCVRAKSVSLLKSLVVIQLPVTLTLCWNFSHPNHQWSPNATSDDFHFQWELLYPYFRNTDTLSSWHYLL